MKQNNLPRSKKIKYGFALILILFQVCLMGTATTACNNSRDPDAENIYCLLLKRITGGKKAGQNYNLILNARTLVSEFDVYYMISSIKKNKEPIVWQEQTLADFIAKNKESKSLAEIAPGLKYPIKEIDELKGIIKSEKDAKWPNLSGKDMIICFSNVGFNKKKNQAIVIYYNVTVSYGSSMVTVEGFVMKKKKGNWAIEKDVLGLSTIYDFSLE